MARSDNRWLIMIYLSGDNNLSAEMVRAINDIASVGMPETVAVTIQYDPVARGVPTLRYYLAPGEKPQLAPGPGPIPLANDFESVDAENAADPEVLSDFIVWSFEKAKHARPIHRMLV